MRCRFKIVSERLLKVRAIYRVAHYAISLVNGQYQCIMMCFKWLEEKQMVKSLNLIYFNVAAETKSCRNQKLSKRKVTETRDHRNAELVKR